MHAEISFWLSVGLMAIVSVAVFKISAGKFGKSIPALADLAAFI